jgi:hypothetical protein
LLEIHVNGIRVHTGGNFAGVSGGWGQSRWFQTATLGELNQVTVPSGFAGELSAAFSARNYQLQTFYLPANAFQIPGGATVQVTFRVGDGGPVTTPPSFTTHPASQTVTAGQNVTFTAAATGNPAPTFQWQESTNGTTWTAITGATGNTLTRNAVTSAMNNRQYRALAINTVQTVPSGAATLTVSAPLIHGDVNGDGRVDSTDVFLLRRWIGANPAGKTAIENANPNFNIAAGKVTPGGGAPDANDVTRIRRWIAAITKFNLSP